MQKDKYFEIEFSNFNVASESKVYKITEMHVHYHG